MKKQYVALCFLFCLGIMQTKAQYTNIYMCGALISSGTFPEGDLTYYGKKFYGLTNDGGANSVGVVFCVDTNGRNYKVLHSFNTTDGENPGACGVVCGGGKIFGCTPFGGTNGFGTLFSEDTNGQNFKILKQLSDSTGGSPYGKLTLVHNKLYV